MTQPGNSTGNLSQFGDIAVLNELHAAQPPDWDYFRETKINMSTRKEIGKIRSIEVGFGGYQGAMFGVSIELGSDKNCWGVGDFKGMWSSDPDEHCKWTKKDQDKAFASAMRFMLKLCEDAGVSSVRALTGKPVEVTFEDNTLKGWRILKEVL